MTVFEQFIQAMKWFAMLGIFACVNTANACMIPEHGAQYDRQVKISKETGKHEYSFTLPASLSGLTRLEVTLAYTRKLEGRFKLSEVSIPLDYTVTDDMAVGAFVAAPKTGLMPYLYVMWWPDRGGLCGIRAQSELLSTSNN